MANSESHKFRMQIREGVKKFGLDLLGIGKEEGFHPDDVCLAVSYCLTEAAMVVAGAYAMGSHGMDQARAERFAAEAVKEAVDAVMGHNAEDEEDVTIN